MKRFFVDERDTGATLPAEILAREYAQKILSGDIDPSEQTFDQYIEYCLERNGGTLRELSAPGFRILARVTLVRPLVIEAENIDDAIDQTEEMWRTGKLALNDGDFAGIEYLPCCSSCGSDFDSTTDLIEASDGALVLCPRCLEKYRKEYGLEECK